MSRYEIDRPLVVVKRKDHTEYIANCPISKTGYAITSTVDQPESEDFPFCWGCPYNKERAWCAYARISAGIPDDAEIIGFKTNHSDQPIYVDFMIGGEKYSSNLKPGKDMGRSIPDLWEQLKPSVATFVNLRTGKYARINKDPKEQFEKYNGRCYGRIGENEFVLDKESVQVYGVTNQCWDWVWYKDSDGNAHKSEEKDIGPSTETPTRPSIVKKYDKLVRDNIPDIIRQSGKTCVTEEISGDVHIDYLFQKLSEEGKELQDAKSIEELADVAEVVLAIRKALGISAEELKAVMEKKRKANGGFDKGIVLKEIIE